MTKVGTVTQAGSSVFLRGSATPLPKVAGPSVP